MRFMASTNKPRVSLGDGLWLGLLGISLLAGWRIMSADPMAGGAASGAGDSRWGGWLADLGLCVALVAAVGATGYVRCRASRHRSAAEQGAGATESSKRGIDSALLSAMSHDLRTPMTGILGALELLGYSELNEHQRMLLLSAENASRTLQRMLDDVLNLARLEVIGPAPGPSPFDLRELLAQEVASWRDEGTEVSVTIADHVGVLLIGYGEGIKQASSALARYAVLSGGEPLRLDVGVPREGGGWQEVEWQFEAEEAAPGELSIRKPDRVSGMEHERELARRLVDRWCERAGLSWWDIPDGARIRFGMKGRFERGRRGAPDIHENAGDDTPSRVVLVAEDNEMVRALLGRQLELLGWEYELVNDGVEAFEAWSRKRYALLVTDCQMPGMDGIELARRIRAGEKKRQLPIVALTANPSPAQRELCLQAGIDDVLPKSMRGSLLTGKLQSWLRCRPGLGAGGEPPAGGMPRQADADQVRTRMNEVFGESAALLEAYLGTMRQEQAHLQSGIAAGDTARLRQVGHSLSGMSAFFGARSLSDAAASVERSESAIDVIHYARKLHACIDEFIDWVRASSPADHIFPTSTRNISEGSHRTI